MIQEILKKSGFKFIPLKIYPSWSPERNKWEEKRINSFFSIDNPSVLTDMEWDQMMEYYRWIKKLWESRHHEIHLNEAFEIFQDEVYEICMDHFGSQDENAKNHFKDLLWKFKKWRSRDTLDVQRAKSVPIHEVVRRFGHEPNRAGFIKCPFHDDKTASVKLFTKNNTWWCFGCQQGSDGIDFVLKSKGGEFIDAVKFLGG